MKRIPNQIVVKHAGSRMINVLGDTQISDQGVKTPQRRSYRTYREEHFYESVLTLFSLAVAEPRRQTQIA